MKIRFTIRDLLASMLLVGLGITGFQTIAVLAAGAGAATLVPIFVLLWFGCPAFVIACAIAPLVGREKGVHFGLILQLVFVTSLAVVAVSRL
jgi:hypothetical protein